jgi:LacI family transcriptional regulator
VSVIGFDDIRLSSWETFGLTTVRQPVAEMARTSVDLLAHRLASPREPAQQRTFPSVLVLRSTCGRVKGGSRGG